MKERKKRKEPRVKMHATATVVRLQYATEDAAEVSRTMTCHTTDISMSGIRFSADWHMPHDMPIKITAEALSSHRLR
ncbi:MAG: PilZ domain-containing protein [Verrucomicrobia bacterium]|nr:PilZ domain-containing protein [Verrucomicrobiota bacterium]MDA1086398.1 PilZ domain-containing protein [Verrucomicrobiota bacterium]